MAFAGHGTSAITDRGEWNMADMDFMEIRGQSRPARPGAATLIRIRISRPSIAGRLIDPRHPIQFSSRGCRLDLPLGSHLLKCS